MPVYNWSQTASSNATADATVNWAEGQAPSTINDSARAMMAATAKYRDDIAGAIVTAGTSTAYTVSSYSGFDTLAHLAGQVIAFTPHTTNGATVTLNVDGLGAKPLRSAPNADLLAGVLIQGTPYLAVYNSSDGAFYLQSFFGNPYNIPLAAGLDFWGTTAPNSSFAFAYGQAISRTTYSGAFALMGTTYGTGDGSTTFNLPDKRGRVSAGKDNMGGTGAGRLQTANGGLDGTGLGNGGGADTQTLTLAQLPTGITSSNSSQAISVTTTQKVLNGPNTGSATAGGTQLTMADPASGAEATLLSSTGNNSISVTSNNTNGSPHSNVQPTIICNYIIRII